MGSCSKCCCYSVPSSGYASKKICLQLRFIWVIAVLLNRDLLFLSHDKMKLQPTWPIAVVLSGKKSLLGASCSWEEITECHDWNKATKCGFMLTQHERIKKQKQFLGSEQHSTTGRFYTSSLVCTYAYSQRMWEGWKKSSV